MRSLLVVGGMAVWLAACGGQDEAAADGTNDTVASPVLYAVAGDANFAVAAKGWYRGDLHYHTTHSGDAQEQGGDDVATALAIADAYRDPLFVKANPDLAGNGLDFIAITDHRTDAALSDPAFHHNHLILLPGEEFGGPGHAGVWGLKQHIPHDPAPGKTGNDGYAAGIVTAHQQGALFSLNHPTQDGGWAWDLQGFDGIEVWNGPWSAFFGPTSPETLQETITSHAAENPYIREAVAEAQDEGANAQALRFWQHHLSGGIHVAPVGGGDRHMLVPAGLPTTYVHPSEQALSTGVVGKALGPQAILDGIKARRTFVSRSPFGAQVELEAEAADGKRYAMGSDLPGTGAYQLHVKVGRAKGGLLRLYGAPLGRNPDQTWPDPQVLFEEAVTADLMQGQVTWTPPAQGGWVHAVVLEPRIPVPLPDEVTPISVTLNKLPTGKALGAMIQVLLAVVDPTVVFDGAACDPTTWKPWKGQCMPVDKTTWATYYMPDGIVRLMSTWFEDGKATSWSTGAISAAFIARPPLR